MEAGEITDDKVIEALRIIKETDGPILIHCWHGSDRTGLVSAMYRIVFQGWTKEDAIDELTHGRYGHHTIYGNIPEYIEKADIVKIKATVFAP
jgi:protein tyrosine/serine phosphatase